MGGVIGLDYAQMPFFLRLEGVDETRWVDVVDGIQVMEEEAVRLMQNRNQS